MENKSAIMNNKRAILIKKLNKFSCECPLKLISQKKIKTNNCPKSDTLFKGNVQS